MADQPVSKQKKRTICRSRKTEKGKDKRQITDQCQPTPVLRLAPLPPPLPSPLNAVLHKTGNLPILHSTPPGALYSIIHNQQMTRINRVAVRCRLVTPGLVSPAQPCSRLRGVARLDQPVARLWKVWRAVMLIRRGGLRCAAWVGVGFDPAIRA